MLATMSGKWHPRFVPALLRWRSLLPVAPSNLNGMHVDVLQSSRLFVGTPSCLRHSWACRWRRAVGCRTRKLTARLHAHPPHPCRAQMLSQRRKLPPMINDRSLFTRAAPFGDKDDPFYHSPSNRIGNNFSPASGVAAAILFEEFPAVSACSLGVESVEHRRRRPAHVRSIVLPARLGATS